MDRESLHGKVQTVLGLIDNSELGFTLTHEHVLSDFRILLSDGITDSKGPGNMFKCDVYAGIREALLYKEAGGNTIVDVTPVHTGRNPQGLARIARETGVFIIMGTSYFTESTYTADMEMNNRTVEDIARQYIDDITLGVDGTGIKAGIIGEIGCSWPMTKNERKCLTAAALAQQETGVPVSIHPGNHPDSLLEISSILIGAGVKPERIILGHMETACPPDADDVRLKLAGMGCCLQFDTFSIPDDFIRPLFPYIPDDEGRVDQIIGLVMHGYQEQILISHDSLSNSMMAVNGGPGIIYILKTIVPLMKEKGLTEEQIHTITVVNPARVLSIIAK